MPPKPNQQTTNPPNVGRPTPPGHFDPDEVNRRLLKWEKEVAAKEAAKERARQMKIAQRQAPVNPYQRSNNTSFNTQGSNNKENEASYLQPRKEKWTSLKDDQGHTPDSQVVEDGDCSPGSEGVKRVDRKDVTHWPSNWQGN